MFTDTVNEFFVAKKKSGIASVRNIIIIVLSFLISIPMLVLGILDMVLLPLFILGVAGVAFFCYKLVRGQDVEFEYSFLTGEMNVDRIINKEKRKKMFKFEVKNVEQIGVYDPSAFSREERAAVLDVSSGLREENGTLFMKVAGTNIVETGKVHLGNGFVYIVVENDERLRKAVKPYIRASVYREGMKNAE